MPRPRPRLNLGRRRGLGSLAGLDPATIRDYAAGAGFAGPDLDTAVAIALAESSGNPGAIGDRTLGVSVGLWQINLRAHPEFAGWKLADPQVNAAAAFSVYSRSGFRAWSTFNSGAYRSYLNQVPPAPLTIDASTGLPIDDSTPTALLTSIQAQPNGGIILLGAAGIAAFVLADMVLGD